MCQAPGKSQDAYVVEPNSEPPFLPSDQVPLRLERRALRLHHAVRLCRRSPGGNQVWVVLGRRVDFVAKGLTPSSSMGPHLSFGPDGSVRIRFTVKSPAISTQISRG